MSGDGEGLVGDMDHDVGTPDEGRVPRMKARRPGRKESWWEVR